MGLITEVRQTTENLKRYNYIVQQIINLWNNLPSNIVTSTSVNMFKNRLDDYWKDVGNKS